MKKCGKNGIKKYFAVFFTNIFEFIAYYHYFFRSIIQLQIGSGFQ